MTFATISITLVRMSRMGTDADTTVVNSKIDVLRSTTLRALPLPLLPPYLFAHVSRMRQEHRSAAKGAVNMANLAGCSTSALSALLKVPITKASSNILALFGDFESSVSFVGCKQAG